MWDSRNHKKNLVWWLGSKDEKFCWLFLPKLFYCPVERGKESRTCDLCGQVIAGQNNCVALRNFSWLKSLSQYCMYWQFTFSTGMLSVFHLIKRSRLLKIWRLFLQIFFTADKNCCWLWRGRRGWSLTWNLERGHKSFRNTNFCHTFMQTRPAAIHKRHFESVKLPGIECTLHKGQKLNNLSKWKVGGEYRLLGEYLNSFFHGKNYTELWPIYSLDIGSNLLSFANSKSGFRGQWIIG